MAAEQKRGLRISEEWIKEKINLHVDCLGDVRTVSLPGSYHEKIIHLGRSLYGFTRLKQLDLSRNAIQSLEGMEHLTCLESLNLYYNSIGSLKDLFNLRHNSGLKELDLRLNPVTKDDPDYRLFVVHMLANLRKLDDRPVTETERKAALMHFDTDQAYEMMKDVHHHQQEPLMPLKASRNGELGGEAVPNGVIGLPQHVQSRKDLVRSLAPCPTEGTVHLMEELHKRENAYWGTLPSANGRENSGSPKLRRASDESARKNLKVLIGSPLKTSSEVNYQEEPSHQQPLPPRVQPTTPLRLSSSAQPGARSHPPSPTHGQPLGPKTAAAAVRGPQAEVFPRLTAGTTAGDAGRFSTAADSAEQLVGLLERHAFLRPESKAEIQRDIAQWFAGSRHVVEAPNYECANLTDLRRLQGAMDLRESELAMKNDIISQQEQEIGSLRQRIEELLQNVERIKYEKNSDGARKLKLEQAERDLVTVQKHVHKLQAENDHLHLKHRDQQASQQDVQRLHGEIAHLREENSHLRGNLKSVLRKNKEDNEDEGSPQTKHLVAMLQESHHSLVASNNQLLLELQTAKQLHAEEVQLMHLNYQQLRRTVDIMQHT